MVVIQDVCRNTDGLLDVGVIGQVSLSGGPFVTCSVINHDNNNNDDDDKDIVWR